MKIFGGNILPQRVNRYIRHHYCTLKAYEVIAELIILCSNAIVFIVSLFLSEVLGSGNI